MEEFENIRDNVNKAVQPRGGSGESTPARADEDDFDNVSHYSKLSLRRSVTEPGKPNNGSHSHSHSTSQYNADVSTPTSSIERPTNLQKVAPPKIKLPLKHVAEVEEEHDIDASQFVKT